YYMTEVITAPVKEQLRLFHQRRVEEVKRKLERDPTFTGMNRPTGFTQIAIPRDQIEGIVKGKSSEEISARKKPGVVKPRAPGTPPSWYQRWLGGKDDKSEDHPLTANEEPITDDQLVKVWIRHETPINEAAEGMEAIRIVGDFDTLSTLSVTEGIMVFFKVCL